MSRGLEAGGTRGRRDAAPASSGYPGGRAGPPPSGGRGQRGQRWKDRPPRCPLGSAGRPWLRTPIQPEPVPRTPLPRPARPTAPGEDEKDQAERRRRPRGRAPGRWTRPRAAIADPRPRARPPASAPQLLTSSPGGCARPPLTQISAARTPRGGTQGPQPRTPSPPARPPASRPSRSPLGMLPCEPPYYGATKLCALPVPLHSSRPPSLLRSLAPAYLLISLRRRPSAHSQPSVPPIDGRG
ncbi:translation initiation factor IF-2-like [Apodemus sylvaticus]|uniref:translation initiation factor IF-2-like n=1 Tax=Apodemus sylvaticus TaxID=10129 RepID=UPI0022430796|nr:translation initiation factor IF-2-like [Apodemus sylvaticus]